MIEHATHVINAPTTLSSEGLVAADGTIWSHACTVGSRDQLSCDATSSCSAVRPCPSNTRRSRPPNERTPEPSTTRHARCASSAATGLCMRATWR